MSDGNGKQLEYFKTSSVCEITGLSATVLRAWERRYGFLNPERLPGGHRLYSRDDLEVLRRVKHLTDRGFSVGELAEHGRDWLLEAPGEPEDLQDWYDEAAGLVNRDLRVFRRDRYRGESLGVPLDSLDPRDLASIVLLYEAVSSVYELWRYMDPDARNGELVWRRLDSTLNAELLSRLAQLGSLTEPPTQLVSAALEDAKFGALAPLKRILGNPTARGEDALRSAVTLCRDHSKILRNAFTDLDVGIRAADESPKVHSLKSAVSKLSSPPHSIEVHLESDCAVSSRCLETSALDRILYSFLRKLNRGNVGRTRLWVGEVSEGFLRFAFQGERQANIQFEPEELATLAVSLAAGVSGVAAIEQSYLGSSNGWVWFHWPILRTAPDAHFCDCEI